MEQKNRHKTAVFRFEKLLGSAGQEIETLHKQMQETEKQNRQLRQELENLKHY